MEFQLKLTVEEINAVLQTLGQLPTQSGAWMLYVKIKEQQNQIKEQQNQINAQSAEIKELKKLIVNQR